MRNAYRSSNIWQLGNIYAAHIPGQRFGHRIKGVLALIRGQQAIENTPRHGQLQLHFIHRPSEGVTRPNGQIQSALFPRFNRKIVPNVDGNGHHGLGADVIGHEPEVSVGRYEGEQALRFPALETHAGMEGDVVKETRIHEGKCEVRHARQLDAAIDLKRKEGLYQFLCISFFFTYMSLYLSKHRGARLIYDGVHLLDDIKVRLIIGVPYTAPAPRNRRQLTRRKYGADTERKSRNQTKERQTKGDTTHLLLPVTVLAMVRRILGGLISSLRMLLSVASGKPLSSISSSSS